MEALLFVFGMQGTHSIFVCSCYAAALSSFLFFEAFYAPEEVARSPEGVFGGRSLSPICGPVGFRGVAPHHRPRAGYCPSSLYTADGSNIRHSPSLRYQDAQISRRLVDSSRIQDHFSPGQGQAPSSVRGAVTTSQFQEIVLDPISGHDLSRHADPVSSVHCKTDRDEGRNSPQDHRGVSSPGPPAALWRRLQGHLSSLPLLVKGGMLRMQSIQIRLRSRWDFRDELLRIHWDPLCQT